MSYQPSNPSNIPASAIAQNLQHGDSPLDFVMRNRRDLSRSQVVPNPADAPPPQAPQPQSAPEPQPPTPRDVQPSFQDPAPYVAPEPAPALAAEPQKVEAQPEAEKTELSAEDLLDRVRPKKEKEIENLRSARKTINELKSAVQEKESAYEKLQREIEKYKTGEAMPEKIESLSSRIKELEKYEHLHSLRTSREYQEKYVEPLTKLGQEAADLANEYGVDPNVLNQALSLPNKKERNAFLARQFGDEVSALEARTKLDEIERVRQEAMNAELEPQQHLERLREEHRQATMQSETKRRGTIATIAEKGWMSAIDELRQSREYPMLEIREGDEEHNKYSKPLLEAAAHEYGKFSRLFGEKGLQDLPEDAAKILAKRFLISQAASVIAASGKQHYERAEQVVAESKRQAAYVRPPIGGGVVRQEQAPEKQARTPESVAKELLRKVGVA